MDDPLAVLKRACTAGAGFFLFFFRCTISYVYTIYKKKPDYEVTDASLGRKHATFEVCQQTYECLNARKKGLKKHF